MLYRSENQYSKIEVNIIIKFYQKANIFPHVLSCWVWNLYDNSSMIKETLGAIQFGLTDPDYTKLFKNGKREGHADKI